MRKPIGRIWDGLWFQPRPQREDLEMNPEKSPGPTSPGDGEEPVTVALPVDFELPNGFESDETGKLVARAKAGEIEALNELFARYHRLMIEDRKSTRLNSSHLVISYA